MGKRKSHRQLLNELYSRPLPLVLSTEAYGVNLYPHNGVSWLLMAVRLVHIYTTKPVPQSSVPPIDVAYDNGVFKVTDEDSINTLWRSGFFGKGVLSRSEPTWKERTVQRLHLESDNAAADVALEDITRLRREERKRFKLERAKVQELELKQRQEPLLADELLVLETLRLQVTELKNANLNAAADEPLAVLRAEDEVLVDLDTNTLKTNLEYLQLQAVEAFFLRFGLNAIAVSDTQTVLSLSEMFSRCCQNNTAANNKFVLDYVVYHHYRSLGWCVRSGIKFGCDMLLYKRGPPFTHAEHAVVVIPNEALHHDWFDMSTIARVIGTVKKNLVLVYVDYPPQADFDAILARPDSKHKFVDLLQHYKVTEILYKRWAPGRTRD